MSTIGAYASVLNPNSWAVAQTNFHDNWMLQVLPPQICKQTGSSGGLNVFVVLVHEPGNCNLGKPEHKPRNIDARFTNHLQKALEIEFRLGHIGMCKPFGALFAILQVFLRTRAYLPWNQLVQHRDKSQQALLSGSTRYLGSGARKKVCCSRLLD